jgi:demethylmenaquinone methyltransferase/2-methoxy-6-polyprenyl-1,4-benzoquinol methylase/phosphoethanolamine N-methyltransferase
MHNTHQASSTRGRTIRWAPFYDPLVKLLTFGRDRRIREATLEIARITPGDRVLDVGCGTGDLTLFAGMRAAEVYGIDAAQEMITFAQRKAAKRHSPVKFQAEPIEALSFPDASFDVVLSSLMFHHLPDDLKRPALLEVRRVLKPGGCLLIVDFKRPVNGQFSFMLALHGNMQTGLQDVSALVSQVGFSQVETGTMPLKVIGYVRAVKPA